MERKINAEMFVLRSVACLSIALLHALYRVYDGETGWVKSVGLLLTFGTPVFVFVSQFVLSYAYPDGRSNGFWSKRVKYVLLPYFIFGTLYAGLKGLDLAAREGITFVEAFWYYLWRHILLGDFHGYFILVIFQFYVLHLVFQKYAGRFPPISVFIGACVINFVYLAFFNFTDPGSSAALQYVWDKMYWLFFPGWLVYFTSAYYLARRVDRFRSLLRRYRTAVWLLPIATGTLVLLVNEQGWLTVHSSKRVDMVLFASSMIVWLFAVASTLRKVPWILEWTSRYSFGIYLLHPLLLAVFVKFPPAFALQDHGWLSVGLQFAGCVVGSAIFMQIANRIPGGMYVVGRIGIGLRLK
ncbi:acyltransferase family protein [Paenibacillus koleovorans]|uniref:acyltransferase family protein n=1 Tax=Paenibacillus koleovorans TaxID=121608 RepID=UPI000FD70C72|nr:acyltransferase family protein [Paenibacillus koleovorans]